MINTLTSHIRKNLAAIRLFLIYLSVLLLSFGIYMREGFGSDSLIYYRSPEGGIRTWSFHGRYLATAVNVLLLKAGFSATDHYRLCFVFFLLCLSFALLIIHKLFAVAVHDNGIHSRYILVPVVSLIFVNVLFCEYFSFPECFLVFPFSFLFCSLGSYVYVNGRKMTGIILLTAACLFYQLSCIAACMIITTYYIIRNNGLIDRKLLTKTFANTILVMIIGVLDLISTNILAYWNIIDYSGKTLSLDISSELYYLKYQIILLFKSSLTLLPAFYIPLLFMLLISIPYFAHCILQKNRSGLICFLLFHLYMFIMMNILAFLNGPFYFPRLQVTFYLWQVMTLMISISCMPALMRKLQIGACIMYLLLQIVCIHQIAVDHYISNDLDMHYASLVINEIKQYESETGTAVDTIACTVDTNCSLYYPDIHHYRDQINERAIAVVPYSIIEAAGMPEKHLDIIDMPPEIYTAYFKGRNWDSFDLSEQLVIIDHVAYYCVY